MMLSGMWIFFFSKWLNHLDQNTKELNLQGNNTFAGEREKFKQTKVKHQYPDILNEKVVNS